MIARLRNLVVARPALDDAARRCLRATYRYQQRFIAGRGEFPFILNAMGLVGTGAEIGVRQGGYSRHLLRHWRGRRLYAIDPWQESVDDLSPAGTAVPQADHDAAHQEAVRTLAPFGDRAVILRERSLDAAAGLPDAMLDFCYIDARHEYDAVRKDIDAWFPKVRPGGVLAGHDYMDGLLDGVQYGVRTAVDEFCRARGCRLVISHEARERSWFMFT